MSLRRVEPSDERPEEGVAATIEAAREANARFLATSFLSKLTLSGRPTSAMFAYTRGKPVLLLDVIANNDGGHDFFCGGQASSIDMQQASGAHRYHFKGPAKYDVTDCGTNGYFMARSSVADAPQGYPTAAEHTAMLDAREGEAAVNIGAALLEDHVVHGVPYSNDAFPKRKPSADGKSWVLDPAAAGGVESFVFRSRVGALPRKEREKFHKDLEEVGVPSVLEIVASQIPMLDGKTRTMKDYVDEMCIGRPMEARGLYEPEAGNDPRGHTAILRRLDGARSAAGIRKGEEPPHNTIGFDQFGEHLSRWTHWCCLDESGPYPRGSIFVRYVSVADAYRKYPELPIFPPDHPDCTPVVWEEHCADLRTRKLDRMMEELGRALDADPSLDPRTFAADWSDERFDFDKMQQEVRAGQWGHVCCLPRAPRADGAAGADDYLYIELVCSVGRHATLPENLHLSTSSGFGVAMIKAALKFAEQLGVRRMVLSALPEVVSYYSNALKFDLCSRHGRNLQFLGAPYGVKVDRKADTWIDLRGSRYLDVYYPRDAEDETDPTLAGSKRNPPMNFHDAYQRRLNELMGKRRGAGGPVRGRTRGGKL